MSRATLLIAHGSREERSNREFLELVDRFSKGAGREAVLGAFLDLASPSIPEAIDACVTAGAKDVLIVPLMLFWGKHVAQDVPKMIDDARKRHPRVRFQYAGPLADQPEFIDFLNKLVQSPVNGRVK